MLTNLVYNSENNNHVQRQCSRLVGVWCYLQETRSAGSLKPLGLFEVWRTKLQPYLGSPHLYSVTTMSVIVNKGKVQNGFIRLFEFLDVS